MEGFIKRVLMASRWLLAPLFLGLALVLLLFIAQFFLDLLRLAQAIYAGGDVNLTLAGLRLVDLVLVASLIVMVMVSGFENFIGRMHIDESRESVAWLTQLGIGSVKVRIVSAVAVISAIYLLEVLFDIDSVPPGRLIWLLALHLAFVVTALLLAVLDRIAEH